VVAPRKVALAFLWGKALPDPHKVLEGSGNQVRNLRLDDATVLDRPPVQELIREAVDRSTVPFDSRQPNRMVIRSVSAKRRPRRPSLVGLQDKWSCAGYTTLGTERCRVPAAYGFRGRRR